MAKTRRCLLDLLLAVLCVGLGVFLPWAFRWVENGDRIAQMVVARHENVEWVPAESLTDSERGEGGFGHTGRQ